MGRAALAVVLPVEEEKRPCVRRVASRRAHAGAVGEVRWATSLVTRLCRRRRRWRGVVPQREQGTRETRHFTMGRKDGQWLEQCDYRCPDPYLCDIATAVGISRDGERLDMSGEPACSINVKRPDVS